MNDRVFIDSNVLIYAYSDEEIKREKALGTIKMNESIISIQVINEFVNVVKKKFNKKNDEILEALEEIEEQLVIWDNYNLHLTKKAINLNERYMKLRARQNFFAISNLRGFNSSGYKKGTLRANVYERFFRSSSVTTKI